MGNMTLSARRCASRRLLQKVLGQPQASFGGRGSCTHGIGQRHPVLIVVHGAIVAGVSADVHAIDGVQLPYGRTLGTTLSIGGTGSVAGIEEDLPGEAIQAFVVVGQDTWVPGVG